MANDRELGLAVHAIARNAEELAANLRHFANLFGVPNDDKEVAAAEEAEEEEADGKKRKRPHKIVDPLAPERAQSAYNHFIKENYTAVKQKFEGGNRELMTELGVMWKKISPEKKKEFEKLAIVDKKRFEVEQKKYEAYRAKNPFDPKTEGVTMNSKKQKKKLAESSAANNVVNDSNKKDSDDDSSSSSNSSSGDSDELDSDEEESTPAAKKATAGSSKAAATAKKNDKATATKKKPLPEKQSKGANVDNQDRKKKRKTNKHKKSVTAGGQ